MLYVYITVQYVHVPQSKVLPDSTNCQHSAIFLFTRSYKLSAICILNNTKSPLPMFLMISISLCFRIFVGGVAIVDPDPSEVPVRRRPVERVARQSGGVSRVFTVSRHGPKRSPGARQIRGATSGAVAVRRHHAGRRRDGDPWRRVPSDGRRGRVR